MTIWYYRYQLKPKRRLSAIAADGAREGALIRVDDGFADVHPWPELGDAPIDEQLELLRRGETTPLTLRSLAMARIDADARRAGRNLFEGLPIPPSHWPAGAGDPPVGFDTVKMKIARAATIDARWSRFRLRLDFNATFSAEECIAFVLSVPRDMRIDFLEDPCPYDVAAWSAIRRATGMRLALDRGGEEEAVDVLVVKPAVQELPRTAKPVVITSYMDHPLGQLGAAYVAATSVTTATCGLVTHVLYEPDPFIERMRCDGSRLLPVDGSGIGFDDLLEQLPWKKLA